jgi:cytochrome c553
MLLVSGFTDGNYSKYIAVRIFKQEGDVMKRSLMQVPVWVAVTALTAAISFATVQQPNLPDAPGKQLLNRACTSCHDLDPILSYRITNKERVGDMVSNMIAAGAVLSAQEVPILVDYLFANLGPKPAADTDDAGKAILEKACTSCHGLDGMKNHVFDTKDPYKTLVTNMLNYGASVTDAELPVLVDYLFKTYGKK